MVVRVYLHEPRFHGRPEWPPAPARLFQAFVAGLGHHCCEPRFAAALEWLERQRPPTIVVPPSTAGQSVTLFVPHNDLDSKGGDPSRVPEIRVGKTVEPRLLESNAPLLYVYRVEGGVPPEMTEITERLYQFGRGTDPAWAQLETFVERPLEDFLASENGEVHHPSPGGRTALACPRPGTFSSLEARHAAWMRRLESELDGRSVRQVFNQPPKPLVQEVGYGGGARRFVYDVKATESPGDFRPIALASAHPASIRIRDAAAVRLGDATGAHAMVDATLVGRRPNEAELVPTSARTRIVPLASIGHTHADMAIRRVLVEIPSDSRIRADDLHWAFDGLDLGDQRTLVATEDRAMLEHYTRPSRRWQTVTPIAVPIPRGEARRGGTERLDHEGRATQGVLQALRRAGVREPVVSIHVHREPSHRNGSRADAFESGRFGARLWHVDIVFRTPIAGPLMLGDGRFLGLGLFAPVDVRNALRAWSIEDGLVENADWTELTVAFRRAVLARCGRIWRSLPQWISGHQPSGRPAERHQHLHFAVDLAHSRLLVFDPEERRSRRDRARFDEALAGLIELRAGAAGLLTLAPSEVDPSDPIVASSTVWSTVTPYGVRRHTKAGSPAVAVEVDVRNALNDADLPQPQAVHVLSTRSTPRGLTGHVRIEFAAAVSGPLMLGRTRHKGGGLFTGTSA
ncbi:MAG: type I-U CRISPR-associated protein Csb2 [Myxococcota bacterium]